MKERKRIGERIVRVRRDSLDELVELWAGKEGLEEGLLDIF